MIKTLLYLYMKYEFVRFFNNDSKQQNTVNKKQNSNYKNTSQKPRQMNASRKSN